MAARHALGWSLTSHQTTANKALPNFNVILPKADDTVRKRLQGFSMRSVSHLFSTLRQATIMVSLLAFLLGGIMGSALILCFGEDGHVAVELAKTPDHDTPSIFLQDTVDHVSAAVDCLDVPAIQAPRSSVPRIDDVPLAPLLAIFCVVWSLASRRFERREASFTGPHRDVRLKHHRSVVLLN